MRKFPGPESFQRIRKLSNFRNMNHSNVAKCEPFWEENKWNESPREEKFGIPGAQVSKRGK